MSTEIPVWRVTLDDKTHELHSLAWFLFGDAMNVKYVAKRFADQKEQAIEFCYVILDDKILREEEALGSGFAPIHAIRLLAKWQVTEALPRFFDIIEHDDSEIMQGYLLITLRAETVASLSEFETDIFDMVIEFAENHPKYENRITFVETLRKLGQNDERTFNFICTVLEEITNEEPEHIFVVAENLLKCNFQQGKIHLREFVEHQKDKDIREFYDEAVEDVILEAEKDLA
jgi:hypothetical protein